MRPIENSFGDLTLDSLEKEQDSDTNGKREGRLIIGVDFGVSLRSPRRSKRSANASRRPHTLGKSYGSSKRNECASH